VKSYIQLARLLGTVIGSLPYPIVHLPPASHPALYYRSSLPLMLKKANEKESV